MSCFEDWLVSWLAYPNAEQERGEGDYPDHAKALAAYLSSHQSAAEAAACITSLIDPLGDVYQQLYRLGNLFGKVVRDEKEHRVRILELLKEIQRQPSILGTYRQQLTHFGHAWSDMHRLHMHGVERWEEATLSHEEEERLREYYKASAEAEAWMYLHDIMLPVE